MTTPKRSPTQDLAISIILALATGLFVGALAAIAGFLTYNVKWHPCLAPPLIIIGSIWILNRQMLHRLNRVYYDHQVTSTGHRIIIGTVVAISSTLAYSYSLSATAAALMLPSLPVTPSTALYMTLCGPLAVLEVIMQTSNISAIIPWLAVGGWLIPRAAVHHPSLQHLNIAQEQQKRELTQ